MLSCIFGKCSSETYIVTDPKSQLPQSAIKTNGVAKINPLLSEFNITRNTEDANHINNEQQLNVATTPVNNGQLEPNGQIKAADTSVSAQAGNEQLESTGRNTKVTKPVLKPSDSAQPESNVQSKDISKSVKASAPKQPQSQNTHKESGQNIQPVLKKTQQHINLNDKDSVTQSDNSEQNPSINLSRKNISEEYLASEQTWHPASITNDRKNVVKQDIKTDTVTVEERNESIYEQNQTVKAKHQAPAPPKEKITSDVNTSEPIITTNKINEETLYEVKISAKEVNTEIKASSEEVKTVMKSTEATGDSKVNTKEHVRESTGRGTKTKEDPKTSVNTVIIETKTETVNSESKTKTSKKEQKGIVTSSTSESGSGSTIQEENFDQSKVQTLRRRSGVIPLPIKYDEKTSASLPKYPKAPDDEALIKTAIESNDFLNKILSGKRLEDVINSMYNKEIAAKETIIKQGEKGSHMYVSAKGKYQVVVKGKVVSEFDDVQVFGELAILYNAKRLATIKALTPGRVWVLDRSVYQQIMLRYNVKEQDEIMEFLMNNKKLNVVGKDALQEVANLLKSEFFLPGKQIVRQGDKGHQFFIIRAGTVTISKDGEGVVGQLKKGECFGELALLKEDCRQATVTANAPGVECLTLTRKEFIDHFGELDNLTDIKVRPQDSIKDAIAEHEDINLHDLKIIKTLGVGGFGRVELVQHTKKKDLVFALKYLKKIDIVLQHQQEHVYNEKNIQMASKSPFIVRLYRTYKDSKYIYLLMESCLGGDLWSLLQKQKQRRFEEKEARFIAGCVLEAFDYLHSRGIIYRDLKPENLLISSSGYIKLTDFGFAKKISSRGRTFTFAGTPEYVAPEIVLNRGHDRAVDYWAFGAFIFELLTGRTPFRTDDSSHMKTYNKILNGIDNIQFPSYVNLKARHIIEKLCRPVPSERLGMQRGGIKDIKAHKWFLGFEWQKFAKCEVPSPFKPKLKNQVDTQYFDQFKKDTDIPPDEISGWDVHF